MIYLHRHLHPLLVSLQLLCCFKWGVNWDYSFAMIYLNRKAEIWDGSVYTLLGHFATEDGAARAYDR